MFQQIYIRHFNKNKNTHIQTDTSTHDIPQKVINCIQIIKQISAHFGSIWSLQFCEEKNDNNNNNKNKTKTKTKTKQENSDKFLIFLKAFS